ncbi:hypothetical protein P154DRAFT_580043 [Amniculicola lignicola CBS 123094]|uniref:Uncharacterized protein n=1 Tax=Amniculicola lignicola CBS 123094 TaxID=1392246 RepID=A0A6A5W349_9PLEO|nr:hypothetical protein P154DRAFT_580043 [Amniculicola lignicola CBS 123094]
MCLGLETLSWGNQYRFLYRYHTRNHYQLLCTQRQSIHVSAIAKTTQHLTYSGETRSFGVLTNDEAFKNTLDRCETHVLDGEKKYFQKQHRYYVTLEDNDTEKAIIRHQLLLLHELAENIRLGADALDFITQDQQALLVFATAKVNKASSKPDDMDLERWLTPFLTADRSDSYRENRPLARKMKTWPENGKPENGKPGLR